MSAVDHPNIDRFEELVSLYLDATLDAVEEHELLEYLKDAALADRFYEATRLHTEIAGLFAGSIPDEAMTELVLSDIKTPARVAVPAKRRNASRHLLALAALLTGLLVISGVYFFYHPISNKVEVLAQVSSLRGEVYLVGPTSQTPLTGNQSLKGGGTIRTVGVDSRASIALPDGTQVHLMGNTVFTADLGGKERDLVLLEGTIHSSIQKQPENNPLIFTTPNAVATVRGTELALIAGKKDTYLVVTKGSVALQRMPGDPEVMINAGFYGHVEEAATIHPWPVSRLPRAVFDEALLEK